VDSQNVLRLGLRNKLQTKRSGVVEDFATWALYTDWRLRPLANQATFADIYSDAEFAPFHWLSLSSELRYNVEGEYWKEANHYLTLLPGPDWSLSVGHRYLRDDPFYGVDSGHNLISTRFYYRFNENWGFRATHHFEARDGTMEEQIYTMYRDFRSWTGALSFRIRESRGGRAARLHHRGDFQFESVPALQTQGRRRQAFDVVRGLAANTAVAMP
jgi:LPS-assembly protein